MYYICYHLCCRQDGIQDSLTTLAQPPTVEEAAPGHANSPVAKLGSHSEEYKVGCQNELARLDPTREKPAVSWMDCYYTPQSRMIVLTMDWDVLGVLYSINMPSATHITSIFWGFQSPTLLHTYTAKNLTLYFCCHGNHTDCYSSDMDWFRIIVLKCNTSFTYTIWYESDPKQACWMGGE